MCASCSRACCSAATARCRAASASILASIRAALVVGGPGDVVQQLGAVQQVADAVGVDQQGEHCRGGVVDVGGAGAAVDHRLLGVDLELGPGRLQRRLRARGLGGAVVGGGHPQRGAGLGDVAVGLHQRGGDAVGVGAGVGQHPADGVQLALDPGKLRAVGVGGDRRSQQQQDGDQQQDEDVGGSIAAGGCAHLASMGKGNVGQ